MADLDKFTEENDFTDHALKAAWKNPQTRYRLMEDISILLMELSGWTGIYLAILFYKEQTKTEDVLGLLGLPLVYLISYLLRRLVPVLWGILLGHLIPGGLALFLMARSSQIAPEITTLYVAVLFGCVIGAVSHYRRGTEYISYTGKWYLVPVVVILFFWGLFAGEKDIKNLGIALGIVLILFHLWCAYLERINDYLAEQGDITNLSKALIFMGNTYVVTRLLFVTFLGMLVAFYFQNDGFFEPVKDYVLYAIRKLILWLGMFVRWVRSLWNGGGDSDLSSMPEELDASMYSMEFSQWLNHPVVLFLGALPFLILLAFAVREFIIWLKKRRKKKVGMWGQKPVIPDEIEELVAEETESFWETLKRKIFRTKQEKVRYLFKMRVKRSLRDKIRDSQTARTLGQEVEKEKGIAMDALTGLYEVARYSEQEITTEEIKAARKQS
ncbi:MAG: DUF4129 domain-containing protein [Lachnospiraceae bacterium]|nr:DUF4129 domain-containing protein [Lachnospiraceae bacterium]